MRDQFIIALDQGTTSSRSVLFDVSGRLIDMTQIELTQIYPQPGWVEHNPQEILDSQIETLKRLIERNGLNAGQIAAIGITNQRETTVVWDRNTGKAICNAIVWQDRRTAPICEDLKDNGHAEYITKSTGLIVDSYFSGTKLKWILDNVKGAREMADAEELLFGTIDTWLLWHLTKGEVHATDFSNASRTMLFDISRLCWDEQILELLGIPRSILPEVRSSSGVFGLYELSGESIPIAGIAGDQQAALFGQACFEPGKVKNTYGTGCFMLMNTGNVRKFSENGLLSTIAWEIGGKVCYALEGSVFVAGAAIQWLRDGLEFFAAAAESEAMAIAANPNSAVYVVPAFTGLGAPYWDMYARGAIFGLTRDTGKNEITRATLQSIAFQTKDLLNAMEIDSKTRLSTLQVDGGACANNFLMQFQADILDTPVERPVITETTALGAAYLAGIGVGLWSQEDIARNRMVERRFEPCLDEAGRSELYRGWQNAVSRTLDREWNQRA